LIDHINFLKILNEQVNVYIIWEEGNPQISSNWDQLFKLFVYNQITNYFYSLNRLKKW